ncbi:MAG: cell division protein ZapE [Gammaproteobacteria bacterium]|jgi:cell division protein ZapE|nr:cell division protein ZapE [Chromatiales bacterium]MCP4926953.1 cell division protein ZapE [Gammaproteobacteria bacterium]MDP7153217.1 cell division protein ZapE [Gammaproteobacteria bacterium]MDP7297554.1 cell division protein ZapE [Gammaproteobacteria bacterium]MDP7419296.1 cell division protein ZapE [Gammaproteobacteria bacterium]
MNLHDIYAQAINEQGYTTDAAQLESIAVLERIRNQLLAIPRTRLPLPGVLQSLLGTGRPVPVPGAYLWGDVGRGKTFVMDLFFDSLPFENKLRQHFHRMMYYIHNQLQQLAGQTDPLETVAQNLAKRARVICFDEFFVADIADAMILGRLLDILFRQGVTLIATSNFPPDELYLDGLQRQKFLPAIELLKQHTQITGVNGNTDYRLRVLEQAEIYHSPLDDDATSNLVSYFERIAPESGTMNQSIEVHGRKIPFRRRADGIAWFDFAALCDGPRNQNDYIEIARSFQTIILSDLPILDSLKENQARRFIALVDEFYDRRVKLIIAAAAPISAIYSGRRLNLEFERTRSRLWEMQSHEYLAAQHRP